MAGYRALAAVGRSIVALLNQRFAAALPVGRAADRRAGRHRDFDSVNSSPSAVIRFPVRGGLLLPALTVDRETRPGLVGRGQLSTGGPASPLRMHLMISAWDKFVESELEWLGLAARVLESDKHPDRAAAGPESGTGTAATPSRSCRTTSPWTP